MRPESLLQRCFWRNPGPRRVPCWVIPAKIKIPTRHSQHNRGKGILLVLTIGILVAIAAVLQLSPGRSTVGMDNLGPQLLNLLLSPLRSTPHIPASHIAVPFNSHQYADEPVAILEREIKSGHAYRVEIRSLPAPLNHPGQGPLLGVFVYRRTGMDLDLAQPTAGTANDLLHAVQQYNATAPSQRKVVVVRTWE